MVTQSVSYLSLNKGVRLAYVHVPGRLPGVVFLPGFRSDMTGGKALALEALCRARGCSFLRFDYQGHGQSSGKFIDGTLGQWAADAIQLLDEVTQGPQILVGSSMGGWLMLLAALARPSRVAGLVGVAAAPDFTADFERTLSPVQKQALDKHGRIDIPSDYSAEPTPFTKALIADGRRHLLLSTEIALTCPIRLLHGMCDPDVPWQTSLTLARQVQSEDVVLHFVKDGDHRLSRDSDIDRMQDVVAGLLDQIAPGLEEV